MAVACLGSINLTRFVKKPSQDAHFDWETYRKAVKIFTRMLDNVVEINGLPLPQQREESLASVAMAWVIWDWDQLLHAGMKYGDSHTLNFNTRGSPEGCGEQDYIGKEKGRKPHYGAIIYRQR